MKITEEQLQTIIKRYEELDAATAKVIDVGCMDPEGPLYNAIWRMFDDMLSIIDPHGWVSWYIHDNEMGAKGFDAEAGSKMIKVTNLKQLLSLINYEY
jgi:hypothetical protein